MGDWFENKVKGDIAERIVFEMFVNAGFKVHNFGIEKKFESIIHRTSEFNKENLGVKYLRQLPDFIVETYDIATGKKGIEFLEVKYRKNGMFEEEEKSLLDKWLLIVSSIEPHFQIKYCQEEDIPEVTDFMPLNESMFWLTCGFYPWFKFDPDNIPKGGGHFLLLVGTENRKGKIQKHGVDSDIPEQIWEKVSPKAIEMIKKFYPD